MSSHVSDTNKHFLIPVWLQLHQAVIMNKWMYHMCMSMTPYVNICTCCTLHHCKVCLYNPRNTSSPISNTGYQLKVPDNFGNRPWHLQILLLTRLPKLCIFPSAYIEYRWKTLFQSTFPTGSFSCPGPSGIEICWALAKHWINIELIT